MVRSTFGSEESTVRVPRSAALHGVQVPIRFFERGSTVQGPAKKVEPPKQVAGAHAFYFVFWRTRATCLCIEPTRNGCQFVFLPGLEVLLENGSGAQWMNSPGWDGPLGLATTSCPNSRRWRTASRLIGNFQNSARVASWLPV